MPKIPRLSGRKLISILEAHGYELKRQRGSHVVMRNGSSVCVVPNHKEIKTGTLAGVFIFPPRGVAVYTLRPRDGSGIVAGAS